MNYPWTHGISAMKKMDCLVQYTSKNIKRKFSLAETVNRCDHTWRGRRQPRPWQDETLDHPARLVAKHVSLVHNRVRCQTPSRLFPKIKNFMLGYANTNIYAEQIRYQQTHICE